MPEERRISPAVVIPIGLGLGLAAVVGIYALSRAAPPGPPTGVPWEFTNVRCSLGTEFPGDWWQVDFSATVTNVGDVPATKTVTLHERSFVPVIGGGFWTDWSATQTFQLTLAPGESYDFFTHLNTLYAGGEFYVGAKLRDSEGYESVICQAPAI